MKLLSDPTVNIFGVMTILAASLTTSGYGQQAGRGRPDLTQQNHTAGIVSDSSTAHVIFSNPGTEQDAILHGRHEEWLRIVNDPRYRMQQAHRNSAGTQQYATPQEKLGVLHSGPIQRFSPPPVFGAPGNQKPGDLHADWSENLRGGGLPNTFDKFPAKYTFSPIAAPDCVHDYVVYTIGFAGASNQANLVGVNNLYSGTCSGTVPNVMFTYFLGTGTFADAAVLSEDGTKVALVEDIIGGSKFHVLTIGTTGNNGTIWSTPVTPCTVNGTTSCSTNNAADFNIVMSGGVTNSNSSPFVDYTNDIAYVGDDSGKLHKFTPVFNGTPAEVTTGGWPVTVASGVQLTDPVFDGGASQNIFVGGSDGNLYCIVAATASPCSVPSITVGAGGTTGGIVGAPLVDSTLEKVYVAANNSTNATLTQVNTSLGSQVTVAMGVNGTDLYSGVGDNQYYTTGTGYWYFCGNLPSAATPALRRVLITNGAMSAAADSSYFQLVITGNTGPSNDCSPLTEYYNPSQGVDYLYLSLQGPGFATISNGGTAPNGTPVCGYVQCVVSFSLPTSAPPNAFPTQAYATVGPGTTPSLGMNPNGTSGIIIDNSSTTPGASQLYFTNYGPGTGVQVSQSALR